MNGGYEDGYKACNCFWGRDPGSLLPVLQRHCPALEGLEVLDAGCGEGKNAVYLARLGAHIQAIDVSQTAINNARAAWPDCANVDWQVGDVCTMRLAPQAYHIVIAYGLLHCLPGLSDIRAIVEKMKEATRPNGLHVVCAFNSRHQELHAHPGFSPTLASHSFYLGLYAGWDILHATDLDLRETHPHNQIPHTHSMTRLIARKVQR